MPIDIHINAGSAEEALEMMARLARGIPAPDLVMPDHRETRVVGNVGSVKPDITRASDGPETSVQEDQESDGNGPTATNTASPSSTEIEVDSDGLPFDPDTMTGTKLKSGQWRMKNGVERPAAPNGSTSTASTTETASTPNTDASDENAGPENEPSEPDDEDEFAAFRDAAAQEEPAEAAPIGARNWTDADLGALCNQAALKMGDPEPIKKLIASFTPEGQVAHSRNIPQDQREAFAVALEQKADIEFAG